MIFATVGTHHQPFERFVRIALAVAGEDELVLQHGHTPRVPSGPNVHWHEWLPPEQVATLTRDAELVITHAGVASIVDAVRAGHRPIVVARRRHLGEHVDDHQLQIVAALEDFGLVTPLRQGHVPRLTRGSAPAWPPPGLKQTIRQAVGV